MVSLIDQGVVLKTRGADLVHCTCALCGHEGGDGRAAYELELRAERIRSWPVDRQQREARAWLHEAARELDHAESAMVTAVEATVVSGVVGSAHEADDDDREYFRAAGHVYEAQALLRDAAVVRAEVPLVQLMLVEPAAGSLGARARGRWQVGPGHVVVGGRPELGDHVSSDDAREGLRQVRALRAALEPLL